MEATGVYWKPVWHVLEGAFELILANAAQVRNLPGRKTDVNDAMWLADLLAHGLIRGSFVPPTVNQDIRVLTRTRKQLVRERVSHVQRIQKVLEDANIKLSSVLSDIMGASGRAILTAISKGEAEPEKLAELAHPRARANHEELTEALRGYVRDHHRFMLKLHLEQIHSFDESIRAIDEEVGRTLAPFHHAVELLVTMPGVGETTAQVIVAEVGTDRSRFPSSAHLVSWAGLCPRSDESAGKRRSTRTRKGSPWLKPMLVQAAWAAIRVKDTYLRAQYYRIRARRGPKKAIVAVAASMLTAVYHMMTRGQPYKDLGADHFDKLNTHKRAQRLMRRLRDRGYDVELKDVA
jgi:transposase